MHVCCVKHFELAWHEMCSINNRAWPCPALLRLSGSGSQRSLHRGGSWSGRSFAHRPHSQRGDRNLSAGRRGFVQPPGAKLDPVPLKIRGEHPRRFLWRGCAATFTPPGPGVSEATSASETREPRQAPGEVTGGVRGRGKGRLVVQYPGNAHKH